MIYTQISWYSWIKQDSTNDLLFSITVNENPQLLGDHALVLLVSSVDYPDDITPKMISLPISVICTDPELIEEWTIPPIWEPTEYDQS